MLHVEAKVEVALVCLDPVASRVFSVLDLPERQGADLAGGHRASWSSSRTRCCRQGSSH